MLIAEIGNNHFGDMNKAKEMIRAAHNSGADLIKGQAFKASDIKSGSMSRSFYRQCELQLDEYLELIEYAREIGNDLFFSVFSPGFEEISLAQKWHKLAGSQTKSGLATKMSDVENMIISVPAGTDLSTMHKFKHAELLYVCEYLAEEPHLEFITCMSIWMGKQVGYSDHTIGIKKAIEANQKYGAHIIEKHFCLKHSEKYGAAVFRDTVHGATPQEFEKLAKALS